VLFRSGEVVEALAPAARMLGAELAARLGGLPPDGEASRSLRFASDPETGALLELLGHDPVPLDELVARTGRPAAELSAQLLLMELDGLVGALPGNRYQRVSG